MNSYENYVTLLNINDGAPGQPGAPGKDAQKYRIETSQEEILKFYTEKETEESNFDLLFSPDEFEISIYELDSQDLNGQIKIPIKSKDQLKIFYYDQSKGWIDFILPEEYYYKGEDEPIYDENGEVIGIESQEVRYTFYSIINGNINLYFNILKNYASDKKFLGETDEQFYIRTSQKNLSFYISKKIKEEDAIIKLKYNITDENNQTFFTEQIITIRKAMTEDLAKLSLKANGIYSSIASTALEFTADGLYVRNGGLKIFNKNSEQVLKADTEGNLILTGEIYATNGVFNGEVQATSGTFNGTIKAKDGAIGGFIIGEHSITSEDLELHSSYIQENGESIESKIIAKNIEIGTGAQIQEYIELGNFVKIWNPSIQDNNIFIQVLDTNSQNAITLNENGTITLGDVTNSYIQLDGAKQEIFGYSQNTSSYGWKINPQEAIFNNIVAQGSIKAASFEYGAIQSVGGTLLIRPSSRIKKINGPQITLENINSGFYSGDLCTIENNQGNLNYYFINSIEGNIITLHTMTGEESILDNTYIGSPIINLGKQGAIGIGINGSSLDTYGINANSISVVEHNGYGKLDSKIILGKLPNNIESFGPASNTYGLYAENVVLNGSLTTKTATYSPVQTYSNKDFSYSGIGTTLGYEGAPSAEEMQDRFPQATRGQILFWAGAKGMTKEEIEASKFFIDQYGNMYAGSGFFEGTIITKSTIEAAEIKTAILTGTGKNNEGNPALLIRDVSEGIHFYNSKSNKNPVFRLSDSEFVVDDLKVTLNKKFVITKEGGLELSRIELKDGLVIDKTIISYSKTGSEIYFKDNSDIVFKPAIGKEMAITSQGVSINGHLFYMDGTNIEGEYRQIKNKEDQVIGYDLYIY